MEDEAPSGNNEGLSKLLNDSDERPQSAINSVILDYYKKFGRKRDLEQYFSLTTAQCDIRDPRSLFWRRMKELSDTSDSGEKKSESSNEICRISIKCSIPERSETEKGNSPSNNESESPPIINDVMPAASPSGDESIDDNQSQKSADATLDTSINKPLSPTSSITSQRKLEWDSLADVGYGNESDKKTSASSLSTLEREVLAQKQQYTLEYKQTSDLGLPTAHSTPVDPNDSNPKGKKGLGKKTISISRKDVDTVEVNVPHNMENVQPINVNLTKQFSLNLQKDGGMTIDNIKKDISVSPEKNADTEISRGIKFDKEIQTSLLRSMEKDKTSVQSLERASTSGHKIPILIGLNTLRRKQRTKKIRKSRMKLKKKKNFISKTEVIAEKDKSGEQVSEAESFEYMPGHVYNQNQLRTLDSNRSNNNNNNVGNKSSLESSAVHTTDSSKESKYSFSKDLDKTLNVLKSTLKEKYDSNLKKKLVTEIIHRLLKSNYGEGETTPEFLSVLSLTNRKDPTTSTSEADNTDEKVPHSKPKKSILRSSKFDPRNVASTSQSAPNLPLVVDKPVTSHLSKKVSTTTTETDLSNNSAKNVSSSDTIFDKTSSQELYKKYINALKREEAYKQHLRDKELFLKQKLVRSEPVKNVPMQLDLRNNSNLKELIKDLTRNNYDDGSGDASILEGGSSNFDIIRQPARKHRSHSVFTLSSGNSDMQDRSCNVKNKVQKNFNSPRAGPSNWERNLAGSYNKPAVTDSSVQVNINVHEKPLSFNPPKSIEEVKYVCLCEGTPTCHHSRNEVGMYKCPISKPIIKACVTNQPVCRIHSGSPPLKDDNNRKSHNNQGKTENPIIECTRCQQTKLSIHPKISDPSVSDLNIIDSAECVKLINELYRKVSKTSSNTCKSSKDNMRCYDRDEQDNLIEDENEMTPLTDQQMVEQNVIQSCVGCHKTITNEPKSISDNIVIPIQGTNMMLKLSIGGNSMSVKNEQILKETSDEIKTVNREIVPNKINTSLKGPPISDECSKSVQAENTLGIENRANLASGFLKTYQEQDSSFRDPVLVNRNTEREKEIMRRNNHGSVSDSGATARSTYPKTVQISEKKPLLRSNTDTGNLGASSGVQTETIYTKDKETLPYSRVDMKQDLASQMQSKSMGNDRPQPQSIKGTSSEQSVSESSKSSTGERFHSFNTSKNKYSTEWRKLKDQNIYDTATDEGKPKDLILDVIKDITKRYSKKDTDKRNKKKCFKEIITALSYLLDTDDSGDGDQEFSHSSKGVQYSREHSSQSDRVPDDFRKGAERKKAKNIGETTASIPILAANVLPRKSETYERNIKTASSCGTRQARRFSEASGLVNPENFCFGKLEQAPFKTCDKGCGCDGASECKDCLDYPSIKSNSEIYGVKPTESENEALKSQPVNEKVPYSTEFQTVNTGQVALRLEEEGDKTKKNRGGNECSKENACSLPNKIKTCDMGCGCDGSLDCKDCEESNFFKNGNSSQINEESAKPKIQSRRNSPKEIKTTCDRGCGCDGSSECKDCVELHPPKPNNGQSNKETDTPIIPKARCGSPKKVRTTCDKGSGWDGSSECNDRVQPRSAKLGSEKCGKESMKSKKQDRCTSPRKTETCDKGCECDDLSECTECVECQPPRTDRYAKESMKPKKQDRTSSPRKAKTCDKGCGCDGLSECSECIDPDAPKYRTRCGKESTKSKHQNRCKPQTTKTSKIQTTCDINCGCDGTSECKECSHKTGKCDKEILRNKKQDAKKFVNKCVQSTVKRVKSLYSHHCDDSSDIPVSTDPPCCSTDSPTTKIVQKIKKECEKYQKRCKDCKKCEASSTTTVSCKHCRRAEKSHCRHHRCRCHRSRSTEKNKKKCVAYNLIVQTSDSLISEEASFDQYRPLQNVIVRVPKFKRPNVPFREAYAKVEQKLPFCDTRFEPKGRSQSWPNDCGISSTDDVKIANACTVRDYLERNRPDFVNRCASRQNCIRMTNECRSKERSELREQLVGLGSLPSLSNEELIYLAKQLGFRPNRPIQQKIISEREMKKHSEKIYKSLPEVVQKKDDAKKENMKRTNLLMANIFKKNLQKKVLNGDVNISNYSQVVKI